MKRVAKIVLVALMALVLVSGVAMLTPRAAHAVVATFVRDVDNAARHPWAGTCSSSSNGFFADCKITVPPNVEVVIQTLSFLGGSDSANKIARFTLTTTTGGTPSTFYFFQKDNASLAPFDSSYSQNFHLTAYADPSSVIDVVTQTSDLNPTSGVIIIANLQGYTVSLP
jgi:hypothetical protein